MVRGRDSYPKNWVFVIVKSYVKVNFKERNNNSYNSFAVLNFSRKTNLKNSFSMKLLCLQT